MTALTPEHKAYLARLGEEAEPPSIDALRRLHRAHTSRVPWETLWIQLGDRWPIDPATSLARVAARGRGGYCYHLNGAFSELLSALGYRVRRHVGGVHGAPQPADDDLTNHLVLTVDGLASEECPDGTWYVDVGLGDTLHEPLPLVTGSYRSGPYQLSLEPADGVHGDWHLTHDPAGSFRGMSWLEPPTGMEAFAERHAFLSTNPQSPFVQFLIVQRRETDATDRLMGLTLDRLGSGAFATALEQLDDLEGCLVDVFGLDLSADDREGLAAQWPTLKAAHDAWQAALAAAPPPETATD